MDVEKLHRMVFDLSSFEGGGELETREQDLASHHQAKNSVARGGLPARDITVLARYLRETWNQPLPASFSLFLPADGGSAMYRASQAARSAGSKSLLQGSSRAYRLPVWGLQTQLGSIISSGLFSVLRSASRDAAQAVPSMYWRLEAGGCMYNHCNAEQLQAPRSNVSGPNECAVNELLLQRRLFDASKGVVCSILDSL